MSLPAQIDDLRACSVRAATWIAAQCVRKFMFDNRLDDPRLEQFCIHLEELLVAESVVDWDLRSGALALTAQGDSLPTPLDAVPDLAELLENAYEIVGTQIYGAWQPEAVEKHLAHCVRASGLDLAKEIPLSILSHDPLHHGWGAAVPVRDVELWRRSNIRAPDQVTVP